MPISLSIAIIGIGFPIAVIIATIMLNLRYRKKHSREYYGIKSVNRLTIFTIIACAVVFSVIIYWLFSFGVAMS